MRIPAPPKSLLYVWETYLRIRRRVPMGFSGPSPISWPDILAYMDCSRARLTPWEVGLIEALDDIYLSPDPRPTLPEGQTVKIAASPSDVAGVRSVMAGIGKGRRVVKRNKT